MLIKGPFDKTIHPVGIKCFVYKMVKRHASKWFMERATQTMKQLYKLVVMKNYQKEGSKGVLIFPWNAWIIQKCLKNVLKILIFGKVWDLVRCPLLTLLTSQYQQSAIPVCQRLLNSHFRTNKKWRDTANISTTNIIVNWNLPQDVSQ